MAYENGSNIFTYTDEVFLKYINDKTIFSKALQTIQFFENRPDYPYCLEEMMKAVGKVLGGNFYTFFFQGYIFDSEEKEDWNPRKVYKPDEDKFVDIIPQISEDDMEILVGQYRDDIQAFANTVNYLSNVVFSSGRNQMGLRTIAYLSDEENERRIKIIRNDGKGLELVVSKNEIDFLISQLEEIFEKK